MREFTASALQATRRLDAPELQATLERAAVTLGVPAFLDEVVAPTLQRIGHGWVEGSVSVAQEHMATAVFTRTLGWLLKVYEVHGTAPHLVVGTPPGQVHEMGALMVAASAAAEGWKVAYLGPDLPVTELMGAARQTGARAVAVSVVYRPDEGDLLAALREVRAGLPEDVPLLVGGAAISRLRGPVESTGALVMETLSEFRGLLRQLAADRRAVNQRRDRILLTGASGYVGGRLRRALEADGRLLRCMARHPEYLRARVAPSTEVVEGDVLQPESLAHALRDVHTAYYLIHSMASSHDYAEMDRKGAEAFARAARDAGVRRIVYLGGLGHGDQLSAHLESRQEVGRILRESGVPTIEFRASIVIGSGSLSFELVRALVEKLPAMVTPKWVDTRAQPIGIEDLVAYLVAALDRPGDESVVYEIGGPDPRLLR